MKRIVLVLYLVIVAAASALQAQEPGAKTPLAQLEELYASGDLAGALQAGENLLEQNLDTSDRVTALNYLGAICYQLARYDDAVSWMERAVAALQDRGGPVHASLLNDLGECQRAAGDFAKARQTLERAQTILAGNAESHELQARILNNIAGLYRDEGDFEQTEKLLLEALRLTEAAKSSGDRLATAHLNLGELLRFQSRFAEARPFYESALDTARETYPENHPNLVYFLNQFAVLESAAGSLASAGDLRSEALSILDAQDVDYPILAAMLLSDAADDQMSQGRAGAAADLYRRALELRQATYSPRHWEIGANLARLARAELESGSTTAAQVESHAGQALQILAESPVAPQSRADAHAVRGQARRQLGLQGAREDFDAAIEIVEELRTSRGGGDESRARLLARYASYYDDAIDLALGRGEIESALHYSERFRARALQEQLLLNRERLLADIEPTERARIEQADREARSALVSLQDAIVQLGYDSSLSPEDRAHELSRLQSELEAAARAYAASQERLRSQSPAWQALIQQRVTAPLDRVRAELGDGESLLVYWIGPVHAWLIEVPAAGKTLQAHALTLAESEAATLGVAAGSLTLDTLTAILLATDQNDLTNDVRGVSDLVVLPDSVGSSTSPTPSMNTDSIVRLHALWRALVPATAWERIRGGLEVTVLPAGPLHFLPFEALVVDQGQGGPSYWLDEGPPVRYVSSLSTLHQLTISGRQPRHYGSSDVLSVSNPSLAPSQRDLPPLPGAANESDRVRNAFGEERVEVLSGSAATEGAFVARCSDRRYLHLATHGVVDDLTSDVLAALMLARDSDPGGHDGRLQLYEIDKLQLNAQLAVLSACRTAAGKRIEGEGVYALARGFHVAGALRVVASLWPVSDASTQALMGEFFQRIAQAERAGEAIAFSEALRDSKRAVRAQDKWADPFYWAPFLLSGVQ